MSKKLNVTSITNELSEGSAFFRPNKPLPPKILEEPPPPSVKPPEENRQLEHIAQNQPKSHLPERANASTGQRPNGKRIITRNSFEIYEDQMDALRKLSFQEKMDGKLGSMSNMVREAIDNYLLLRNFRK
jgi:hypothetical protein